ncbi:CsbD family protein [Polaribacter sp.]|uniref:CsbD family protein n=1 Tax=Polaribacter sp. TaxID=1920175 RepID=UPI003F6B4823
MNTDTSQGKWKQIKGEFKEEYGKITDNESAEAEGSVDKLVGKIQEKYGETRDKIKEEISNW